MKKLNLLLATTAIMAAGAMAANAEINYGANISKTLNTSVTFVDSVTLGIEDHLDFGIIMPTKNKSITISAAGEISGDMTIITPPKRGYAKIYHSGKLEDQANTDIKLSFSEVTSLKNSSDQVCGTISNFTQTLEAFDQYTLASHFGATFTVADTDTLPRGKCTGTATVTIVRTE